MKMVVQVKRLFSAINRCFKAAKAKMHLQVHFPAWQQKVLEITAGIYTDGVHQLLTSEKVLPLWLKNKKQQKIKP